jgi:hypothetical protein
MNVGPYVSMKVYVIFYPLMKLFDLFDENICSFRLNMVTISQETFLPPVFVFMTETIEARLSLTLKRVR